MTDMPGPSNVGNYLQGVANTPFINLKDSSRNGKFPARLGKPDPEDRKWEIRKSIIDAQGQTDAGMAIAPEGFFDYLDRKSQMRLQAEYEAWAFSQANLETPEAREFWYRMMPWMKEKQFMVLEEQANLQKTMARIKINGPESDDDLKFIFAYKNGLINVSDKPLYDLENSTHGKTDTYKAGIFSPWRDFFITKPLETNAGDGALKVDYNQPWGRRPRDGFPARDFRPTGITDARTKMTDAGGNWMFE